MNNKTTHKNSPKSLDQLKKERGITNWAKLITEEKSSNKQMQPTQKARS